ncbi:hypothetical protein [Streptomyces olivaceoviridis]|uniref:hypothetical protein n=1 Tax=Streptomyces olivaceoviridis TaxID=1921 RepID=UPI003570FE32
MSHLRTSRPPTSRPRTRGPVLLTASAAPAVTGALLGSPPASAAGTAATPAAEVSPHAAQTVDDIGASGAWWVDDLKNFDPQVRARVARLLFSEGGLDVSGQATADGSEVILYRCTGGANEVRTRQ